MVNNGFNEVQQDPGSTGLTLESTKYDLHIKMNILEQRIGSKRG